MHDVPSSEYKKLQASGVETWRPPPPIQVVLPIRCFQGVLYPQWMYNYIHSKSESDNYGS